LVRAPRVGAGAHSVPPWAPGAPPPRRGCRRGAAAVGGEGGGGPGGGPRGARRVGARGPDRLPPRHSPRRGTKRGEPRTLRRAAGAVGSRRGAMGGHQGRGLGARQRHRQGLGPPALGLAAGTDLWRERPARAPAVATACPPLWASPWLIASPARSA